MVFQAVRCIEVSFVGLNGYGRPRPYWRRATHVPSTPQDLGDGAGGGAAMEQSAKASSVPSGGGQQGVTPGA